MQKIHKATPNEAQRLFEIMTRATEVGCTPSYPPEIMEIWHQGRSAEGMAGVIAEAELYALEDKGTVRGFVHLGDAEVVGLFVHPDDHRRGYGTELFRFAVNRIGKRPIVVLATLNAVSFYTTMGCRILGTELVRRHDRDIYVCRMELDQE